MTELTIVATDVEPLSLVEFNAEGRINYNAESGRLVVAYPEGSETTEYIMAEYPYSGITDTVDMPDGAVVVDVSNGYVTAAIPKAAYGSDSA